MNKEKSRPPSRCVFIGNVPFGTTEEMLKDLCDEIAPVVSFRMVYDPQTKKPRGYAFCEYADKSSAKSAIRNLNGKPFKGRILKVDFADDNRAMEGSHPKGFRNHNKREKANYFPHIEPTDAIMDALVQIPRKDLFNALKQMKELSRKDPEKCKRILQNNPVLSLSMVHIQYLLGILKTPFMTYPPPIQPQPRPQPRPPPPTMMPPPPQPPLPPPPPTFNYGVNPALMRPPPNIPQPPLPPHNMYMNPPIPNRNFGRY